MKILTFKNIIIFLVIFGIIVITITVLKNKDITNNIIKGEVKIGNEKGDMAPDFTVITTDGQTIRLSEITAQNKPVLVEFIATWCPFCAQDLAVVNRVYPKYKDEVEFITISLDLNEDTQKLTEYKKKGRHDLINFAPGKVEILRDYNIRTTTTKFAIGRDGIIIWKGSGAVNDNTWEIIFNGLVNS